MAQNLWMMTIALGLCACGSEGDIPDQKSNAETACPIRYVIGDIRPAPREVAAALAITGTAVSALGSSIEAVVPADAPEACIERLPPGAVAFAGFHDSHAHLTGIGLREMTLNLEGVSSIAELKSRVQDAVRGLPAGETLYGRGWIETGWPEGRMPVAADLDAVVADRPVILGRADGHAVVVNSAAMSAAGIDSQTPDPEGGRIERDGEGAATGLLIDNAESYVQPLMPTLSTQRRREALKRGAQVYAGFGWTGVHNMSVEEEDGVILRELAAAGELPLRVYNYYVPEMLDTMATRGSSCTADGLVCDLGIKYYADGALGSRGALLFAPYADAPQTTGLQLITEADAKAAYRKALDADLQITTHAIGDRGNRLVLDWYGDVLKNKPDHRWRIEHAQIVSIDDIPRFADQGIIASMQPSHAIGDLYFAPGRLGDRRLQGAYAWRSFTQTGAIVVGGSDAPVERGEAVIEAYAATRRASLDGYQGANWQPQEALDAQAALALFTVNAAYAVRAEAALGVLAPGLEADISVFSGDPFTEPYGAVRPLFTYVRGQKGSGQSQ
jgi:predicted amidohydrolase YtcJ